MTININNGLPVADLTVDLDKLSDIRYDYDKLFLLQSEDKDSATFVVKGTDWDHPTTVRYATRAIKDIYRNERVAPDNRAPSSEGKQISVGMKSMFKLTDSTDASVNIHEPIKGSISLQFPKDSRISAGQLETFLKYLIGCLLKPTTGMLVDNLMVDVRDPRQS